MSDNMTWRRTEWIEKDYAGVFEENPTAYHENTIQKLRITHMSCGISFSICFPRSIVILYLGMRSCEDKKGLSLALLVALIVAASDPNNFHWIYPISMLCSYFVLDFVLISVGFLMDPDKLISALY